MNAQKRGVLSAIEAANSNNIKRFGLVPYDLNQLPEPCTGIIHNLAGVCPKCKIKFVKWRCTDENGKFLFETFQPYGKYVRDSNSPRIIELLSNIELFE